MTLSAAINTHLEVSPIGASHSGTSRSLHNSFTKVIGDGLNLEIKETLSKLLAKLLRVRFSDLCPKSTARSFSRKLKMSTAHSSADAPFSPMTPELRQARKLKKTSQNTCGFSPGRSEHAEFDSGHEHLRWRASFNTPGHNHSLLLAGFSSVTGTRHSRHV